MRVQRSFVRFAIAVACAWAGFACAASDAFAAASLIPIGPAFTTIGGISADGNVIVGSTPTANGTKAFRWTQAGGIVLLGDMPGADADAGSSADGLNSDGSVIVGTAQPPPGAGTREAFRWTAATGVVGLGELPGGSHEGGAGDVSEDGSVVVGVGAPAGGFLEATRWTQPTGMVGLGDFPGSVHLSISSGVSADGSIVVGTGEPSGGAKSFRWTQATGMLELAPSVTAQNRAYDITADGTVVVGSVDNASPFGTQAYRWTAATGMVGLGDLPGGPVNSFARAVSNDGKFIVGSANFISDLNADAFVWTQATGMRRLSSILIEQGYVPGLDGWNSLSQAVGVSDDGTRVVGFGMRNGFQQGFLAIIPEPAVLAPLVTTGIIFSRRRTRRRVKGCLHDHKTPPSRR